MRTELVTTLKRQATEILNAGRIHAYVTFIPQVSHSLRYAIIRNS